MYDEYILGAIPSDPDNRDYHIAMLVSTKTEFPNEYIIPYKGTVKNQGNIGSCVAHSLSYCREIMQEFQDNEFKQFSTGFIYGNRIGTIGELLANEGMCPRDALGNLKEYGDVLYKDFPINDKYPVVNQLIQEGKNFLYPRAKDYKITTYARLYTVDEVKTALMNLGAVSAMFPIYPSFYKTGIDGIVLNPNNEEIFMGFHQMTIIGWKNDKWIILNSWGNQWADKGCCYISFNFPIREYWSITDDIIADTGSFIELIKPGTIKAYKKYGILPSLTISQAILESNWGRASDGYNLFGIKWIENCGYDKQLWWTWEFINGQWQHIQAYFRKYNSYEESIDDHSKLLMLSRYKNVLAATNYIEACTEVWKSGYATDPNYPKKLIGLIENFGLNKWDLEGYKMFNDFDKVAEWAKKAVTEVGKLEVMVGDQNGNFNPNNTITRQEIAKVIYNMIEKGYIKIV